MSLIVYTSPSCPNCVRLLDTLRRIPSLKRAAKIVDVNEMPPQQVASSGLTAVPTLVVKGRMYTGKEAFEYLGQFNNEIEYEPVSFGGGSLVYGSLGGGGDMESGKYGEFTAPP